MPSVFPRVFLSGLVCALLLTTVAPFAPAARADGPCTTRGDNMTRNGSITDGGYDTAHGTVANSWNAYLVNGDWPEFELADNESANGDIGGSSSQYIHGDGLRFDAGIYQVISGTTPGASYEFSVGWAAMLRDTGGGNNQKFDDVIIRRVGVDPYGGTDPTSQNMQWSPEVGTGSSGRSLNHPDMRITFKAMANQVTVFLRAYNLSSAASDKVFFDVMCLVPRPDIPVEPVEPTFTPTPEATEAPIAQAEAVEPTRPRPTRVPPTLTPTEIPPTPEPARVLTLTPETVAQSRATATPQPHRVIPQVAQVTDSGGGPGSSRTASAERSDGGSNIGGGNILSLAVIAGSVGVIGLSALGMLAIGAFAIWRIFLRPSVDARDPSYSPDDHLHSR